MTINRIVDLRYDRENPRTRQRALATGSLSVSFAWTFTLICRSSFFPRRVATESAGAQARVAGPGHPVFLFFHQAVHHLVASFSRLRLGISPAAAWIAVTGGFDPRMLILCARGHPVGWRLRRPLRLPGPRLRPPRRAFFHSQTFRRGQISGHRARDACLRGDCCWARWPPVSRCPWPAWVGIVVVAALLAYEHSLVKADDLSKLDAAFFA